MADSNEIVRGSHQERTFVVDGREICVWDVGFAIKARINGSDTGCYAGSERAALELMVREMSNFNQLWQGVESQDPTPQSIVNDGD